MKRLHSPIRGYAWGSREFIARIQGRPYPTADPEAELWIGAHPDSPSTLEEQPLDKLIHAAPEAYLGTASVARFGTRLPYLMKVLAAAQPLSIQTHPNAEQAAQGYAAETKAGVTQRSYVDQYHKPELLVALGDFEALCGFRPVDEAAAVLRGLDIRALDPVVDLLTSRGLQDVVGTLLQWPWEEHEALVAQAANGDPLAARLARFYPGDMGVIVALLLNHVTLRAGEAVWMPSGTLHAYLEGAGVEVMAASDNVLRGGLTPKYINVPELLRILRFEPMEPPLVVAQEVAPGVVTWPVPVPDFRLYRVTVTDSTVPLDPAGPRTVLCLTGAVQITDRDGTVALRAGETAFGPANAGQLTVTGSGEVYLTSL